MTPESREILRKWLAGDRWLRIEPEEFYQMPMYRRRESVTALEVVDHLQKQNGSKRDKQIIRLAIGEIDMALTEICGKNGITGEG